MPYFLLEITAQLEKIVKLEPNNGIDDTEMAYFFTLICENCGEISSEVCTHASTWQTYNGEHFNLVLEVVKEQTVNLIPGYGAAFTEELANGQEYIPLMLFHCDGLIPYQYVFNGGWKVTLSNGAEIEDCNLVHGYFIAEWRSNDEEEEEDEEDEEGKEKEEDEENEEDGSSSGGPSGPAIHNAQSRFIQYWM